MRFHPVKHDLVGLRDMEGRPLPASSSGRTRTGRRPNRRSPPNVV